MVVIVLAIWLDGAAGGGSPGGGNGGGSRGCGSGGDGAAAVAEAVEGAEVPEDAVKRLNELLEQRRQKRGERAGEGFERAVARGEAPF